ncbi:MAG TPA: hypothetical protein VJT73_20785 [Polyangiaceae bacterium]|nr:hypothetical protein [Polyangiaceae bacterium]
MCRSLVAVALSVCSVVQALPVRAEAPPREPAAAPVAPDDAAIKNRFSAALKLHKAGKIDEALRLFQEVTRATQSPNARLYVALCLQQLGKNVDAYKAMSQTVREASQREGGKYEQTREAAQEELAVLNVKVGKLVVTLPDVPPGLVVNVDGTKVDERDLGGSIVLEPGSHKVEATATGLAPVVRDVQLDGGETRTVTIAFAKDQSRIVEGEAPSSPGHSMRVASYAAVGVGAAGLGIFAVAGLLVRSKYGSLESACGTAPCTDPKYQGDIDAGKSLQTVANVGLVVGVVALAAGGTLFFMSSKNTPPKVSGWVLPSGGYVGYGASF